MNQELQNVQARFRKGRGTRDQIANKRWITEKAKEFQKLIYFCFTDHAKAFDCVDHNKLCGKFLMKKREALNFVGDKVSWYSHYGKQYQFSSVAQFV